VIVQGSLVDSGSSGFGGSLISRPGTGTVGVVGGSQVWIGGVPITTIGGGFDLNYPGGSSSFGGNLIHQPGGVGFLIGGTVTFQPRPSKKPMPVGSDRRPIGTGQIDVQIGRRPGETDTNFSIMLSGVVRFH
jgi:hypothetical protein